MTAPATGWATPGRVTRVIDGDTVEVEVTRRIVVRLLDCWAPEVRGASEGERLAGARAANRLADLVGGRRVVLFIPTGAGGDLASTFSFGRVLGRLWVDGQDVSEAMVAAGYATSEKAG